MLTNNGTDLSTTIRSVCNNIENRSIIRSFLVLVSLLLLVYCSISVLFFSVIHEEQIVWAHFFPGSNGNTLNTTQTQQNDNYDVDLYVNPPRPIPDSNTNFSIDIKSRAGDALIELPVSTYVLKDGKPVFSNPNNYSLVRQQHYDFGYQFSEPGVYSLVVDIKDIFYTLDVASFAFEIVVEGPILDRIFKQIGNYYHVFIPFIIIIIISAFVNYRKRRVTS